jgi:outer membrane receptor protein involved in Fe transport
VARPTFWEFIPSQTLDQATGLARRGNNLLGQTEIDNFDLGVTWQPTDASTMRVSLFHKNLVNPLVNFFEQGTLTYADSFRNEAGEVKDFTSTINGIEFEAELNSIGPFSLRGNFTYIDATLDYFLVQNGQEVAVNSRLPYQPTYLANLNLGYTYEPWNFNANLIYNYNGDYPVILRLTPEDSEVTRESISTVDLVVSKLIETETVDYTIRAGVKNIFNVTDFYLYTDRIYDSESAGRSYWMEIQISF